MSFIKSTCAVALLGTVAMASSAQAGEFDGKYQFEYQVVGTSGYYCPTVKGHELQCRYISADMRLYDGEFTEESIQGVADQMIGEVEAQSGHDLSPELEAQIDVAVSELFASVGDELNAALDFFPRDLSVASAWFDETVIMGTMVNSQGDAFPVFGSMRLDTGDYVLNSLFHGYIDRMDEYRGKGSVEIPVSTQVENGEFQLSIDGSGFATYNSWQVKPPAEPTGARKSLARR